MTFKRSSSGIRDSRCNESCNSTALVNGTSSSSTFERSDSCS